MQASLRAFTSDDYPAIITIYNASWQDPPITIEQPRAQDELVQSHHGSKFQRYVAEQDHRIVASGYNCFL